MIQRLTLLILSILTLIHNLFYFILAETQDHFIASKFLLVFLFPYFLCYFIGSVCSGRIFVHVFLKKNIKKYGSGNIGATNVARINKYLGIATLFFDMAKVLLGFYLSKFYIHVLSIEKYFSEYLIQYYLFSCAGVVLLGHIFSFFEKLKGGKGVACLCGFLLLLGAETIVIFLCVFCLIMLLTRYVSLASIISVIIIYLYINTINSSISLTSSLISIMILYSHSENIARLLKGQELKFDYKDKQINTENDS